MSARWPQPPSSLRLTGRRLLRRLRDRPHGGRRRLRPGPHRREPGLRPRQAGNAANIYDTLGPFTLKGLPSLALRVRNVPQQKLKLGQSRHLRITVTNTRDGTVRGVKLSLAQRRGLRSTPRTRTIGTLYSGRRKTVTVKVALVRGARDTTDVPITASASKLRAKAEIKLRRRAKKSTSSGGGGSGSSTSPLPRLCSRYQGYPSGGGSLILVPC